jgi:hypothetical protein
MKLHINIWFILAVFILATATTFAQTQKFDVMTYTPPKGWTAAQNGSAKTFTTVDKAAGTFCVMMLHPSITNHGTPTQDFAYVWKTLVQDTFNAGGNPEKQTAEADGFTMISGGELIDYEGTKALALLTTLSGNGKVISLLSIMNDATYSDNVQSFLAGMDINIKETRVESSPVQNGNSGSKPTSIIGEWSNTGSVLANYVNNSGQYVGDASTATTSNYKFDANGTYASFYAYTKGFKTHSFYYKGSYKLSGNTITLSPTFYEHKLNTKVQPNTDPNNMKRLTFSYVFEKNTDTNVWGIKFEGDADNTVPTDLHYRAGNSSKSQPETTSPPRSSSLSKEILGEWYLSDGSVKISLWFAVNGHYRRRYQADAVKPIALNLYQTTTFEGDGTYTLNGSTLKLIPKRGSPETHQVRVAFEKNSDGKTEKKMYLVRPIEGGKTYESEFWFVK